MQISDTHIRHSENLRRKNEHIISFNNNYNNITYSYINAFNNNKNIVVVTNTPYEEISIPDNAESVVITFAESPNNAKVTAGVLFGEVVPEGVWPVSYHA